jgi:heptosyltransferase-3
MIDWNKVSRVLVVKLRSIGDTVLATPSLTALRRFLPDAQIDILLEDWVAPILSGHRSINNVISVGKGTTERIAIARRLRQIGYDVVFNLHGGTTSTFFTRATGAPHRVGYSNYQYAFLYDHRLSSPSDFWQRKNTHSAEQQLALLGSVGVPVEDMPASSLVIDPAADASIGKRLTTLGNLPFVLIHPAAAFETKQWPTVNFAAVTAYLHARGMQTVAISSPSEQPVLQLLSASSLVPVTAFSDLTLPEVTALAARAAAFVGNDSGIGHIAAAVGTPTVVIFGSSNRDHWRPWTAAPHEIVFEPFACQPCAGYECKVFGEPRCILSVPAEAVTRAIDKVLPIDPER